METWGEFDNEECSDKDEGEANLALMILSSSDTEHDLILDHIQNKKMAYFLISLILILFYVFKTSWFVVKKRKDTWKLLRSNMILWKKNKNFTNENWISWKKDYIALKEKDNKPLSEHEIALQEFITSLRRTKLAFMIYIWGK